MLDYVQAQSSHEERWEMGQKSYGRVRKDFLEGLA